MRGGRGISSRAALTRWLSRALVRHARRHGLVAYAVDFVGEEVYTVVVRDAATGAEARTTPLGIRAGASPAASVCIGKPILALVLGDGVGL
jgi:hypothetical protein